MRRLMWFTIGFAVACVLCTAVLWGRELTVPMLYALFAGLLCFALQTRSPLLRVPALLLLGMGVGTGCFSLYRSVYVAPLEALDGSTLCLTLTTTDFSEETDYGYSVEAVLIYEGKPYSVLVYQKEDRELEPGTTITADFKLRLTTPSGQKASSYLRGNGFLAVASQKSEGIYSQSEWSSLWFLPARVGRAAKQHIQACFPSDTAPFAMALLLGDTSQLDYETDTALKVSGIRHIAAVSGLHVSALFGAIYLIFRKRGVFAFLISVPILIFFAAVTGFSPSVTRAVLMSGLMALASAVKEEYDGLTGLSFASLVMLLCNPFVIFSVSFQLSVSSVAGILLFASPIYARITGAFPKVKARSTAGKLLHWFAGAVSVSTGALLFSAPLSACYFHSVSLIGLVSNLLIIWIIPFLFCGIAAVAIAGGLLPAAGSAAAWLLSWPIRLILLAARLLSGIPFGAVYTQSEYVVAWLIFAYCLVIAYGVLQKHFRRFFLMGCVGLAAAIAASVIVPRMDNLRLHVLDVGEGQAILLQTEGKNYLIDCGGDSDTRAADQIAQMLLSQGVFRLNGLLLTHYDQDHVNAVDNLLTRISIDEFYLPAQGESELAQSLAQRYPSQITWVESETSLPLGEGKLTLLPAETGGTDNENSMCILFESPDCDILITGDRGRSGEKELLRSYQLPDVDILIAGHHGSKNSTSEELLMAVRPETVIISVGENNGYGHPAQELLQRLSEFGCTVYRTDMQGSVLIRR